MASPSVSVFERVSSALQSNDDRLLRQIYDDISSRLSSQQMVSSVEHLSAIRSTSSFLSTNLGAETFIPQHAKAKEGKACVSVRPAMIGYILLFEAIFVTAVTSMQRVEDAKVKSRIYRDEIFNELSQSDANMNPGFDINVYRVEQLNVHNYFRSLHRVPSMKLDDVLNQQAQTYAEELARNNVDNAYGGLVHCTNCHGAGENLAVGDAEQNITEMWYNEIWNYDFCNAGKRPGRTGETGHFTQVVWKTSTKLGIGYATTSDGKKVFAVGRYLKAGNVVGLYTVNVLKPDYILETFQDNCDGINGGLSDSWSAYGKCTQECGGGVLLETKTCTNPKPSLNGRDCYGNTKRLASKTWCNVESCPGDKNHRDEQCEARGEYPKSYHFSGIYDCRLACLKDKTYFLHKDPVDDGTHCNSEKGVCLSGVCNKMPLYTAPTQPPPTSATGKIVGRYTDSPTSEILDNLILEIPNGAQDVTITNNKINDADMGLGYKIGLARSARFIESSGLNNMVQFYGKYKRTGNIVGVSYDYQRTASLSTIKISGPVQPSRGHIIVLYVTSLVSKPADISWSYILGTTA